MIRLIRLNDYEYIFELLNQLTDAPKLNYIDFKNILLNLDKNHFILVYEENNIIYGLITLLIEQKLIHSGKKVGHIEDLIVDKKKREKGIAKLLLLECISIAKNNECYKIILDCKDELEEFYIKSNFYKQGICMRYDL